MNGRCVEGGAQRIVFGARQRLQVDRLLADQFGELGGVDGGDARFLDLQTIDLFGGEDDDRP